MSSINGNTELLQAIIDAPNIGLAIYKAVRDDNGNIIDFIHEYVNRRTIETQGQDFTGKLLSDHGADGVKQIDLLKQAKEAGADAAISKPFSIKNLREVVSEYTSD